jgi:hypothetical protein
MGRHWNRACHLKGRVTRVADGCSFLSKWLCETSMAREAVVGRCGGYQLVLLLNVQKSAKL